MTDEVTTPENPPVVESVAPVAHPTTGAVMGSNGMWYVPEPVVETATDTDTDTSGDNDAVRTVPSSMG